MVDLQGTEYEGMILPMLAKDFSIKRIEKHFFADKGVYHTLSQPKLDGVRMVYTGEDFHSRKGKPIATRLTELREEIQDNFGDFPLDGELYVHNPEGDEAFRKVVSNVRSTDEKHDEDLSIEFWVYDTPQQNMLTVERFDLLASKFSGLNLNRVKLIPMDAKSITQEVVDDFKAMEGGEEHLKRLLNTWAVQGYEGTMLRNPAGLYKFGGLSPTGLNKGKVSGSKGRSDDLLKVKAFYDNEYRVVGMNEGLGKHKGKMGAVIVESDNGSFQVGTGFDDKTRVRYWKFPDEIVGKKITVKFQNMTPDGIPRFPVFLAVRDYE